MSYIGLAVIGAGYWGPNLVRTAQATPALQLEWLCDLDEKRAKAVLGRCLAYLSVWLSTGALAHAHVNWLSPTKIRTTVFGGSRRTIVWDDMNPSARIMVHDRGVDRNPAGSLAPDARRQALISYRVGDIQVPALPEREALSSVVSEFASAITEHRRPLTDARSGIRVLELLEAASRSVDEGGTRIQVSAEAGNA